MKCIANIVLLVATFIATTYARNEVVKPRPIINNCYYALYDDNRATLTSCTKDVDTFTIPDYVEYQNKRYALTMIQANAFKGRNINQINVSSQNKALLLKRSAFNGISYLRRFNFYSKKTEPEIDAFPRTGVLTHCMGEGIPYAMEKLIPKYLKKWKLPVGKDYSTATPHDIMNDLFLLAKTYRKNFGLYDKSTSLGSAVDLTFNGIGNVEAYARLYRIFALTMGINENEMIVGHDNVHQFWVYFKFGKYHDAPKWYVIDPTRSIDDNVGYDSTYFQFESDFINKTLKPLYGSSVTLQPKKFVVYGNKYNYDGEPGNNYIAYFDGYITRYGGGGSRTL